MITFNSRIVTIAAILLLLYIVYTQHKKSEVYHDSPTKAAFEDKTAKLRSKYTIKIDPKKHYDEFNIVEKLIYNFAKDKISPTARKKIESKSSN